MGSVLGGFSTSLTVIDSKSQADGYHQALDLFKQKACNADPVETCYSYVIITRHDLDILKPFNQWGTADYGKVNFASPCERCDDCTFDCVNDVLQMMPGYLFPKYDALVGKGSCFELGDGPFVRSDGHLCRTEMKLELKKASAEIGYAWNWQPRQDIRERNAFGV